MDRGSTLESQLPSIHDILRTPEVPFPDVHRPQTRENILLPEQHSSARGLSVLSRHQELERHDEITIQWQRQQYESLHPSVPDTIRGDSATRYLPSSKRTLTPESVVASSLPDNDGSTDDMSSTPMTVFASSRHTDSSLHDALGGGMDPQEILESVSTSLEPDDNLYVPETFKVRGVPRERDRLGSTKLTAHLTHRKHYGTSRRPNMQLVYIIANSEESGRSLRISASFNVKAQDKILRSNSLQVQREKKEERYRKLLRRKACRKHFPDWVGAVGPQEREECCKDVARRLSNLKVHNFDEC
jgi:hypothetical protein